MSSSKLPTPALREAKTTVVITGADAGHFVNSKMLVASWWRHNRHIPLLFCDFGLDESQKAEIRNWPVQLVVAPPGLTDAHAWRCKAGLIRYLDASSWSWRNVLWIDADAVFLNPLLGIDTLIMGYDLVIDAHVQSVGEIVKAENLRVLPLEPADSYFSSGFWITSHRGLLRDWDRLADVVGQQGNLWENDAFVAAIYHNRCSVRTVCGNVWHVRGATSLESCALKEGELYFAGMPARVLHANAEYEVRDDGRRVFRRPELRAVQDDYEDRFEALRVLWRAPSPPTAEERRVHAPYVGHWAGNLGDSAVFDVFESILPGNAALTCAVHSLGPWRKLQTTELIDFEDRAALARSLAAADVAVLPGTTVVTDLHGGRWPIEDIAQSLQEIQGAGKRTLAVGVGVYPGPWDYQRRLLAEEFVPRIHAFTVRDETSRRALLEAGALEHRVMLTSDLAWLFDREGDIEAARKELDHLLGGAPAIAVNLVHEDWVDSTAFYTSVAAELDAFSEETGWRTLFLCNEVRSGNQFDGSAAERVAGLMRTAPAIHDVRWMHPEEMIARIRCCELAVSMRYHFAVFAALADVVWVGFARGGKLEALLDEFGAEPVASMGQPLNGRLLAALRAARSQRDARRAAQRRVVEHLRDRAGWSRHFLLHYLCHGDDPGEAIRAPGSTAGAPQGRFGGWTEQSGLGAEEGPYKEHGLPRVRWGLGPATRLTVQVPADHAARLSLDCSSHHLTGQALEIRANGTKVGEHRFSTDYESATMSYELDLGHGTHGIEIRYRTWDRTTPHKPMAVLFKGLRVDLLKAGTR